MTTTTAPAPTFDFDASPDEILPMFGLAAVDEGDVVTWYSRRQKATRTGVVRSVDTFRLGVRKNTKGVFHPAVLVNVFDAELGEIKPEARFVKVSLLDVVVRRQEVSFS